MRRKSRFVSEFRNQLCRIPLKHRSGTGGTGVEESFVLNTESPNLRLFRRDTSVARQKRTVTEWARKKNFSYQSSITKFEQKALLQSDLQM